MENDPHTELDQLDLEILISCQTGADIYALKWAERIRAKLEPNGLALVAGRRNNQPPSKLDDIPYFGAHTTKKGVLAFTRALQAGGEELRGLWMKELADIENAAEGRDFTDAESGRQEVIGDCVSEILELERIG